MGNDSFHLNLQNIKFRQGVIRTEATDKVIEKLDPYLIRFPSKLQITSILRTAESQLRIIEYYAKLTNIMYIEDILNFNTMVIFEGRNVFKWQLVWSQLLSKGIIISPPKLAVVLTNYIYKGINKKNTFINSTEHIYGTCLDISGYLLKLGGSIVEDLKERIIKAQEDNIGIRYIRIERDDTCIHISVKN